MRNKKRQRKEKGEITMSKSSTTKANQKRLTDDWEEQYHKPTEGMDWDQKNDAWKKTYNKLKPSIDDLDMQEKEDYKKENEKFSKLKKMLRGE
jgi:hypothetical protein